MKHEALREMVARAIHERDWIFTKALIPWEHDAIDCDYPDHRKLVRAQADAAISAIAKVLAEPTPEDVWRTMLSASPLYPEKNDG